MNKPKAEPIVKLTGVSGIAHLFEDRVFLEGRRPGCLASLTNPFPIGDKSLLFDSITAVQIKPPVHVAGFIQFTIPGGKESLGGIFEAQKDENTVTFTGETCFSQAQQIHDFIIESKARERAVRSGLNPNRHEPTPVLSVADELRKLKELLDDGVLTPEEFEAQKKRLLGCQGSPD